MITNYSILDFCVNGLSEIIETAFDFKLPLFLLPNIVYAVHYFDLEYPQYPMIFEDMFFFSNRIE